MSILDDEVAEEAPNTSMLDVPAAAGATAAAFAVVTAAVCATHPGRPRDVDRAAVATYAAHAGSAPATVSANAFAAHAGRAPASAGAAASIGSNRSLTPPCPRSSAARPLRAGSGARPRPGHTEPSSSGT